MKRSKISIRRRIHALAFKSPLMITCEEFEDFILAYLEEDLPAKQKFIFELHIKVCRECRDYLKAYRASMDLTKQALEDEYRLLPEQVPDDLIKAVLDASNA